MRWFKNGGSALVALVMLASPLAGAADFGREQPSGEARHVAQWVLESQDHGGLPFAIVDKKEARLFLFNGQGRLLGASPALLGSAQGDASKPGVGKLQPALIPPHQRTTPAGRFATEPGRNTQGEAIVWFDYDAGLAIHRLRPAPARERRPQRMLSETPADNRISLGCVVLPADFYDAVIAPLLGRQRGLVYVLPETQPAQALFGGSARLALLKP